MTRLAKKRKRAKTKQRAREVVRAQSLSTAETAKLIEYLESHLCQSNKYSRITNKTLTHN